MAAYTKRVAWPFVIVYFALTLSVSYGLWGPYDGVGPSWIDSWWIYGPLLALHLVAGLVLGWLALPLPILWTIGSFGAEGYDTPVAVGIFFQSLFLWIPATILGAAGRIPLRRRLRSS